ncbi:U3 small nucleolar RNA-associated protein 18 homolog [Gastrophryne carolinensis]
MADQMDEFSIEHTDDDATDLPLVDQEASIFMPAAESGRRRPSSAPSKTPDKASKSVPKASSSGSKSTKKSRRYKVVNKEHNEDLMRMMRELKDQISSSSMSQRAQESMGSQMGKPSSSFFITQDSFIPEDESEEGEVSSLEEDDEQASGSAAPAPDSSYSFPFHGYLKDMIMEEWKDPSKKVFRSQGSEMQIFPDRIVLRVDPCYLPKVASDFHRTQEIVIPSLNQEDSELRALDCCCSNAIQVCIMLSSQSKDGDGKTPPRKRQREEQDSKAAEEALRSKNLKILTQKPDVEKCLEDLVFGGEEVFVERLAGRAKKGVELVEDLLNSDSDDEHPKHTATSARKPAWVDEDDELDESIEMTHRYRKDIMKSKDEKTLSKDKLQLRLQDEFQKAMGGVPSWASRSSKKRDSKGDDDDDDESEEEEEDNLLTRTGNLLAKSSALPKGIIEIKSCLNANQERPSNRPLTAVQFHPSAQVLMTAGLDRSVSLFQVDGKLNPKIQSIYLQKFPVFRAQFSADGEQVIATGLQHKIFYVYDMMGGSIIPVTMIRGLDENRIQQFEVSPDGSFMLLNGSAGYLHLLSMKTKELIGSMKTNAKPVRAAFSHDSSTIFSNSDDGDVYVWDVKSRRCLNRFHDDGSLCGTSVAVSRDGTYISCGSNSGVVNIYNTDDCLLNPNPKPLKSIMNLVTTASSQVFSPQTEILALGSHKMDDAVKLVHIPSFTVFSNFPVYGKRKAIHLVRSMDFSPHSGFFSIANNKGEALLYRLKHYSDF